MRQSLRRRFSAVLLVSAIAGTTVAVAADDLEACRTEGQIQVRKDRWTRIMPPEPAGGEGPRVVTAFAASPKAPNRLFATNGTVVKMSADGGCTWNLIDRGSAVGVPNATEADVFTHLVSPHDNILWEAGYDDAGGATRPKARKVRNVGPKPDGPITPEVSDTGLPPVGKPIALAASRVDLDAVYMLVEMPPDGRSDGEVTDAAHHLYTTFVRTDPPQLAVTGLMWKQVAAPDGFGRIEGVTPGTAGRGAWIWSKTKVAYTANAAADSVAWKVTPMAGGTVRDVDVNALGIALVAVDAGQGAVVPRFVTTAGEFLADRLTLPVAPTSMAHGYRGPTLAVSGVRGTFGYDAGARRWVNITPNRVGALSALEFANGLTDRIVLGLGKDALYRFDLYPGESFLPVGAIRDDGSYRDVPHSTISEPYLTTPRDVVTVKPGEIADVPVEFGMPAAPNELDVYFLVDTTVSMQSAINGLRADIQAIAERLRVALGRHACFGLGDFKDFSAGSANDAANVFRTHQRIACEQDESLPLMNDALKKLASSAGGDPPEAQTIALTQMMTGDGQANPPVLPGQQAGFRPESYKVVVLVTDAPFKQGIGYPAIDATAQQLKAYGIKVVNVLVVNNLDPALARTDMTRVAVATDSLAPAGGVDCDNDKQRSMYDLEAGDPLICEVNGSQPNIGPVIVSLLLGVSDPGTLAVGIADPHDVVREPIKGKTSRIFNLKRDAKLRFTMPVSCTAKQDGSDLPVVLTPSARALPLGLARTVVVQCRSVPLPPPPPPRPPLPPTPPDVPVPPPLARLPIAMALPPPPNPPAQPPSNINPNAGFSQQEEQQFQLAAVTQGAAEDGQEEVGEEYAMTGLGHDESVVPVAGFLAGAAVLSAVAAAAHRRRLQRTTRTASARAG